MSKFLMIFLAIIALLAIELFIKDLVSPNSNIPAAENTGFSE